MAWFNFRKNGKSDSKKVEENISAQNQEKNTSGKEMGIHLIYALLNKDNEQKGYDDALINSDLSHMEEGILIIKNNLSGSIEQVKLYYNDFLKEIDFHIESRKSSSMFTIVEELNMKKEIAKNHLERVLLIEEESKNGRADQLGIVRTYVRGFKKGLAAISFTEINRYNH